MARQAQDLSNNATIAIASWLAKMLQLECADFQDALLSFLASTVRLDFYHIPIGKTHFLLRQHMQCHSQEPSRLQQYILSFTLKAGREFGASSLNSRIPLPSNEMKVGFKVMKVKWTKIQSHQNLHFCAKKNKLEKLEFTMVYYQFFAAYQMVSKQFRF